MQAYTDSDGEEYLVFQNERYSDLLFYHMKNQKLYKKIHCTAEGPDAVPEFSGFYVRNMNEIYLSHSNHDGITIIDETGTPLKICKTKSKEEHGLDTDIALAWKPMQEIGNKLYIPLSINWEYGKEVKFQKSNLGATFDLNNHKIQPLPLTFFDVLGREDDAIFVMYRSICTNGKQFVYSFFDTDDIYVTDLDYTTLKRVKAKSKYLSPLEFKSQKVDYASANNCTEMEEPRYGNILYDPYRKVYYRIAYPKAEIEKGINCFELSSFGGKNFSVIILNEDLEIIGETLMPDYTYNPTLCFVRPDGLYISESHIFNPDFDENELSFRLFSFEPL